MKAFLAASLLLAASCLAAQTVEPVPNQIAQQLLHSLIPEGKKMVTVTTSVVNTSVNDVNLGMSCSSSSSGTTTGTVDDDGNVSARTNSYGDTNCRERHIYHDTMVLEFGEKNNPEASYLLTAECTERWVWNHCGMPAKGTSSYPLVIEEEKHGQFTIYVATSDRVGGKPKVAKFTIIRLDHVKPSAQ